MMLDKLLVPATGIYSITIRSEYNGFAQWYVIHVERAPDAEYSPPAEYTLVSSGETISPSGIAMYDTFVPQLVLDIQKLILVYPVEKIQPKTGPSANVPSFSLEDMKDIAVNAFNIGYVLKKLLYTVNASGEVRMDTSLQEEYVKFGKILQVPPEIISELFAAQRCTPQSMMLSIYRGLGLILVQTDEGFKLTDLTNAMSEPPEHVDASNVLSLTSSFDYRNIPKTQTIHFDASGKITERGAIQSNNAETQIAERVADQEGKFKDPLIHRATPGASLSQAVGEAISITAQVPPLVARAGLNDVIADDSGLVTLEVGERVEKVQLAAIIKTKDSMKTRKSLKVAEKDWDYSAAQIVAKRMFMEKLQSLMSFQVITASTSKSAIVDGVAGSHFRNISFGGGEISLQKAIIGPDGVSQTTEEGSIDDVGFVTGLTIVLQSGITTSTITYVNLGKAYDGVF